MRNIQLLIVSIIFLVGICACGGKAAHPEQSVQDYLQALVEQDSDTLSTVVCKDWQDQATLEMDAFLGVDAKLDSVACSVIKEENNLAQITCTGSIIATYNNEQQVFKLEGRNFQVLQEGGEWLVCGYP